MREGSDADWLLSGARFLFILGLSWGVEIRDVERQAAAKPGIGWRIELRRAWYSDISPKF